MANRSIAKFLGLLVLGPIALVSSAESSSDRVGSIRLRSSLSAVDGGQASPITVPAPGADGAQALDAIVVPGGGLGEDLTPNIFVQERLKRAQALYEVTPGTGGRSKPYIIVLSAGTPHKPYPRDEHSGFQVIEAEASAKFLIKRGVAPEDLLEEALSLDTIGNAFFLRTLHTDVLKLTRLHVITNEFHMPRTQAIFESVFAVPGAADGYKLSFESVADVGMDAEALKQRQDREAASLEGFKKTSAAWTKLADVHSFLFHDHDAYASKRLLVEREPVSEEVKSTY